MRACQSTRIVVLASGAGGLRVIVAALTRILSIGQFTRIVRTFTIVPIGHCFDFTRICPFEGYEYSMREAICLHIVWIQTTD